MTIHTTRSTFLFPALVILLTSITNLAATFTVTNVSDSGPGSLRQAILDANAAAGDDLIDFDPSVFNTPQMITLTSGELAVRSNGNITINGPGAALLSVSGNNQSRIFGLYGTPASLTATISNLTIRDGFTNDGGGGISINDGTGSNALVTLNLNNAIITNNQAGSGTTGGGIEVQADGALNISNSIFRNNSASAGGGIDCGSGIGICVSVNIINTLFEGNSSGSSGGGGGFNCCGNGSPASTPINIENTAFINNTGGDNGSAFRENNFGSFSWKNVTFAHNRSTGTGPAVQLARGSHTFENVTIAYNTTTSTSVAGGIRETSSNGFSRFRNTIVAKNRNGNGPSDLDFEGFALESLGYNLFGILYGTTTVAGDTTGNQLGADPMLDAVPRFHGAATKTLNLRPGSPAIDAGDPANFLATDQRGIARPVDGDGNGSALPDIGAFEKRPMDIVPAKSFDYDGDGRLDFSVFRPSTGAWYLQRTNAGFQGLQFGASGDKLTPADYDGDGKVDIAVFRPSTGLWYILNSASGTVNFPVFGVSEDIPAPGDYDGDGKADLTVFRPSQGTWYRQNSSNGGFFGLQFGATGDVPTVGDFDGDGRNDLGIWRPSNGDWYNIRSSDGTVFGERFGQTGDRIAPADYDDDGRTDLAIFRPSTGLWVVRNSASTTYSYNVFGSSGDIPIAGDYDGDGRADIGVWRPSDGTWFIRRSDNSQFIVFPWGQNGDQPTPSAYNN